MDSMIKDHGKIKKKYVTMISLAEQYQQVQQNCTQDVFYDWFQVSGWKNGIPWIMVGFFVGLVLWMIACYRLWDGPRRRFYVWLHCIALMSLGFFGFMLFAMPTLMVPEWNFLPHVASTLNETCVNQYTICLHE